MLEKHVSSELASDKTMNIMERKAGGMEALKVRTHMPHDEFDADCLATVK